MHGIHLHDSSQRALHLPVNTSNFWCNFCRELQSHAQELWFL